MVHIGDYRAMSTRLFDPLEIVVLLLEAGVIEVTQNRDHFTAQVNPTSILRSHSSPES